MQANSVALAVSLALALHTIYLAFAIASLAFLFVSLAFLFVLLAFAIASETVLYDMHCSFVELTKAQN